LLYQEQFMNGKLPKSLFHEVKLCYKFPFYHGATVPVDQSLLIIEDSWSQSDRPHSVRLLWTGDQPDAEAPTWQHTTRTRHRYRWSRRDSNPQSQQASGRRPNP